MLPFFLSGDVEKWGERPACPTFSERCGRAFPGNVRGGDGMLRQSLVCARIP